MQRTIQQHGLPTLPVRTKPRLVGRLTSVGKILLGCGIVSSVLYVTVDVLASLRWYPGYSYRDQDFSELLASGAPTRTRMIVFLTVPYVLLMGAFAVGVWKAAGPRRAALVTAVMLGGYAAISFIGGVLTPMAPREVLAAGKETFRNDMHVPATLVGSLFVLLAMGFGARLRGRRFRWYSYATIVVLLVFGALGAQHAGDINANRPTPWAGIEERVNIYATLLWVVVLALSLWRADGGSTVRAVSTPKVTKQRVPR